MTSRSRAEPSAPEALIQQVRKHYLGSRDFNGLYLSNGALEEVVSAAESLLLDGKIQVVSDADYLNIHIRPWKSRRTIDDQLADLRELRHRSYGVCLYPTAEGMKGVRLPKKYESRPFEKDMAKGRGTLELAYFDLSVLEQYRNDPRYSFHFYDFGAHMGIGDDAYLDESEPEHDKVSLSHIGFAYDLRQFDRGDPESPIVRRVAASYGDLAELSPEHQQRWKTYQVSEKGLSRHPLWWASQMGHWPDGMGPIERMFVELDALNVLTTRAFGEAMFTTAKRPADFGWILRPSQREWDEFIVQMDKMLSENLRSAFFDKTGVPKVDKSGQPIGTLGRLERYLVHHGIAARTAALVLQPLRDVRKARQGPAHKLRQNVNDRTFVHRQLSLLWDVDRSLIDLRDWLSTHPANADWEHPQADMKDYLM